MTWSTRELAEIAGTTVNAVRHYHAIGLLDAPERCANGYKQYGVRHLVRLIQVRRLAEIGVPLAKLHADDEVGITVLGGLEDLDMQLQAEIERLRRARSDIAAIVRDDAPADTPRGFESVARHLSESDRALIQLITRLHDSESVASLTEMVLAEAEELRAAFSDLRTDTPEYSREWLTSRMTGAGPNWRSSERPWSTQPVARMLRHDHTAKRTIAEALGELYNPAQLDVLRRADSKVASKLNEPLSA